MSPDENPESVEAVRIDIEATRADLAETVNELSDRLSPKKRFASVTQDAADNTKQVVEQAQALTKDSATKAQNAAKVGVSRARMLTKGREPQILGAAILTFGLILGWRLSRNRQG
jgi:Protein of unknown function (DUF3618)